MSEEEEVKTFRKALMKIGDAVHKNIHMSEASVGTIFTDKKFFRLLGYRTKGIDIKVQERDADEGKIPDFECIDDIEQSVFVLELKKPDDEGVKSLASYKDAQLRDRYVVPKKSRYGVLSNGIKFFLYERKGDILVDRVKVSDLRYLNYSDAERIFNYLKRPTYEYTDFEQVLKELKKIEPKPLSNPENRESFYELFMIKRVGTDRRTKFTDLVFSLVRLFDELMSDEKSEFLVGAYNFWEESYSHKLTKIPKNWQELGIDQALLNKFMFCLETAHSMIARLILAKVCEDNGIENVDMLDRLENYMRFQYGKDRVSYFAYPFAIKDTFENMRTSLVESLFEEDIFSWWTDIEKRVGSTPREWKTKTNTKVESFSRALAKIFFALRTFDFNFSEIEEDILGELYQHYFDPETRKALGEFYTPIEVVKYILDAVDYNGNKILNRRLLDPACGSGTFVVEALKRYLEVAEDVEDRSDGSYWSKRLKELCDKPKIIGFDINPFAVLMSEIRFMIQIIPYYSRAKKEDTDFVITTIPIFETDSLEIETKTGRLQTQLGEYGESKEIKFTMRLPILKKEGEKEGKEEGKWLHVPFFIPSWDKVKGQLGGKEDYFLLLKHTFEVVKEKARKQSYEVSKDKIKEEFQEAQLKNAESLADIMHDYTERILAVIKTLFITYKDGRLIKSLEDLVLAGVLKNFFLYDYVVGNPPYVRVQLLEREKKQRYEETYSTATGLYDIYVLFIERGIDWLGNGGKFGYIISNQFMVRKYGESLRSFILKQTNINQLLDFGDSGVFKDATNYPLILILIKEVDENNRLTNLVDTVRVVTPMENIAIDIQNHIAQDQYSSPSYSKFQIIQKNLTTNTWNLIPDDENEIIKKCEDKSTHNLKGLTDGIVVGVQTGLNEVYVVQEKEIIENRLETPILKKLLDSGDVRKWGVKWSGQYVIYPYEKMKNNTELIDEKSLKTKYPNLYSYLLQNKDKLEKRWGVKNSWYELPTSRTIEFFERPKIFTPTITNKNNFAYDDNGFYFSKGGGGQYGILLKEDTSKSDHLFLLGLLNSDLLEFYLKHFAPIKSGKWYEYMTGYLELLPIKLPQTKEEQKLASEITKFVEHVLSLAKRKQHIENFADSYFDKLLDAGKIDEFDEVKWTPKRAYKNLEPELKRDDRETIIVAGKNDAIASGKIYNEIRERYVIESIKGKNFSKDKEVIIRIPRSDAAIETILKQFEVDKETLARTPISELEDEINERVYKLYDLTEEDKRVINEFLERF